MATIDLRRTVTRKDIDKFVAGRTRSDDHYEKVGTAVWVTFTCTPANDRLLELAGERSKEKMRGKPGNIEVEIGGFWNRYVRLKANSRFLEELEQAADSFVEVFKETLESWVRLQGITRFTVVTKELEAEKPRLVIRQ